MTPLDVAALLFVGGSVFFSLVAVVGFARLPDVFARAHAASKSETLGALFGLGAAAATFGPGVETVKIGLLAVFILVTGPTAAHAVVRAASLAGATPWTRDHDAGDRPGADQPPATADHARTERRER